MDGLQRTATDNFDPHGEEGTQEKNRYLSLEGEKATKKSPPRALLESALKGQEAGTILGLGAQHKGGMVVVSDRAKKATLAMLLGM